MEERGHQPRVAKRLARVHIHARLCAPSTLLHAALYRLHLQLRLCASPKGVRDEPQRVHPDFYCSKVTYQPEVRPRYPQSIAAAKANVPWRPGYCWK